MTSVREATETSAEGTPPAAVGFDRRVLMRRGVALGVGLAGAGTLARFGFAAQQDAATPAATPAALTTPQIVAATNAFVGTLSSSQKSSALFDWTNTAQKQRWSNFPRGSSNAPASCGETSARRRRTPG